MQKLNLNTANTNVGTLAVNKTVISNYSEQSSVVQGPEIGINGTEPSAPAAQRTVWVSASINAKTRPFIKVVIRIGTKTSHYC